jgi:hypothetical protein
LRFQLFFGLRGDDDILWDFDTVTEFDVLFDITWINVELTRRTLNVRECDVISVKWSELESLLWGGGWGDWEMKCIIIEEKVISWRNRESTWNEILWFIIRLQSFYSVYFQYDLISAFGSIVTNVYIYAIFGFRSCFVIMELINMNQFIDILKNERIKELISEMILFHILR